jgi:hypothetical protein
MEAALFSIDCDRPSIILPGCANSAKIPSLIYDQNMYDHDSSHIRRCKGI